MTRRPGHRGWPGLALPGAVAFAIGLVAVSAALPTPQAGDAAAVAAAVVDASPYAPRARLRRWDGTTLQPC